MWKSWNPFKRKQSVKADVSSRDDVQSSSTKNGSLNSNLKSGKENSVLFEDHTSDVLNLDPVSDHTGNHSDNISGVHTVHSGNVRLELDPSSRPAQDSPKFSRPNFTKHAFDNGHHVNERQGERENLSESAFSGNQHSETSYWPARSKSNMPRRREILSKETFSEDTELVSRKPLLSGLSRAKSIQVKSGNHSFSGVHGPLLSNPIVPKVRKVLESNAGLRSPQSLLSSMRRKPVGRSASLNYSSMNPTKSTAGQIPWVRLKRRESIGLADIASGNTPQSPNTVKLSAQDHRPLPSAPSFKSTPLIVTTESSRSRVVDTQTVISALREKRKRYVGHQLEESIGEDLWQTAAKRRRQDSSQSNASSVSIPSMPESLPNLMGMPGTSLLHIENLSDQRPSTVPAVDAFASHQQRDIGLGGQHPPQCQPESGKAVLRSIQSSLSSSMRARSNAAAHQRSDLDLKRIREKTSSLQNNRRMSNVSAVDRSEEPPAKMSQLTSERETPRTSQLNSTPATTCSAASELSTYNTLSSSQNVSCRATVSTPTKRKIAEGVVLRKQNLSISNTNSPVQPVRTLPKTAQVCATDYEKDREKEYQRRVLDLLEEEAQNGETNSDSCQVSVAPTSSTPAPSLLTAVSTQAPPSLLNVAASSAAVSASLDSLNKLVKLANAPGRLTTPAPTSTASTLTQLLCDEEHTQSSTSQTSTPNSTTIKAVGTGTANPQQSSTTVTVSLIPPSAPGASVMPSILTSATAPVTPSAAFQYGTSTTAAKGSTTPTSLSSGFQVSFSSMGSDFKFGAPSTIATSITPAQLSLVSQETTSTGSGFPSVTISTGLSSATSAPQLPASGLKYPVEFQTSQVSSLSTSSLTVAQQVGMPPAYSVGAAAPGPHQFGSTSNAGLISATASAMSSIQGATSATFSTCGLSFPPACTSIVGVTSGLSVQAPVSAPASSLPIASLQPPEFSLSKPVDFTATSTSKDKVSFGIPGSVAATAGGPGISLVSSSVSSSTSGFNFGQGSMTGTSAATSLFPISVSGFSFGNSAATSTAQNPGSSAATGSPQNPESSVPPQNLINNNVGFALSTAVSAANTNVGSFSGSTGAMKINAPSVITSSMAFGGAGVQTSAPLGAFGETNTLVSAPVAVYGTMGAQVSTAPATFGVASALTSAPSAFVGFGLGSAPTTVSASAPTTSVQALAPSGFGASSSVFGATSVPTQPTQQAFGGKTVSAFGASSALATTKGGFNFGQTPAGTTTPFQFGAVPTQPTSNPFGATTTATNSQFGAASKDTTVPSVFGGGGTAAFGNSSLSFGAAVTAPTTVNMFGATSVTTAFGTGMPSGTSGFPSTTQAANLTPSFGNAMLTANSTQGFPGVAQTTNTGGFGSATQVASATSGFGSTTQAASPLLGFGSVQTPGQAVGFGNLTQTASQPFSFGVPANSNNIQQPAAFGANSAGFGAKPSAPGVSIFEAKGTVPSFGSAVSASPVFGTPTPSITATAPPVFGSLASPPTFGAPSSLQQKQPTLGFGASTQGFGAPQSTGSVFGASSPSAVPTFGTQQNASQSSGLAAFGSGGAGAMPFGFPKPNPFGAASTTQSSGFGASQLQQTSAFGTQIASSASTGFNFGQAAQSMPGSTGGFAFGSATQQSATPGGFNFAAAAGSGTNFNFSATPGTPNNMFNPQTPGSNQRPRVGARRPTRRGNRR